MLTRCLSHPNSLKLRTFLNFPFVDFRFGDIKLPSPSSPPESELFMDNFSILCGLKIWLHQITPSPPPESVYGAYRLVWIGTEPI